MKKQSFKKLDEGLLCDKAVPKPLIDKGISAIYSSKPFSLSDTENISASTLSGELKTTTPKSQPGFPHYRRGGWLQLFRMKPWGWEDRGKCKTIDDGEYLHKKFCHRCNTILHIGRENNQSFRFCPKCLTKIKE